MKKILVVAAHTDDEVIGCGGTISRYIKEGHEVHLLFMTDGVSSRKNKAILDSNIAERLSSAYQVARILGVSSFTNLDFPDNRMDTVPLLDIVQKIEDKIAEIEPEIIYTHHIGDLNIDHQVTHKAVITACRPQPEFCVKAIYAFEVVSSTEWQTPGVMPFTPNFFVDISDQIDIKIKALEIYRREMRDSPHSRSINNLKLLAKHRGYSVGLNAAEAFMLIRKVY